MSSPFDQTPPIDFVDIGCSGTLDRQWADLFPLLVYTGFDPNAEECQRLNRKPHPYRSARYLPYAVGGDSGTRTMYKTKSIYCYSLLRPNYPWVNRFSFSDMFAEAGTEPVATTTLDHLAQAQGVRADIIKVDSQGVDLEILKAGTRVLDGAFCVEVEPGFTQNYAGENIFAPMDEFMRSRGYLLFDLRVHKIGRANPLAGVGKGQPLWSEALYLYDPIAAGAAPTREAALKALRICKALGYQDYGYELAQFFHSAGVLDADAFHFLQKPGNWTGPDPGLKFRLWRKLGRMLGRDVGRPAGAR